MWLLSIKDPGSELADRQFLFDSVEDWQSMVNDLAIKYFSVKFISLWKVK